MDGEGGEIKALRKKNAEEEEVEEEAILSAGFYFISRQCQKSCCYRKEGERERVLFITPGGSGGDS